MTSTTTSAVQQEEKEQNEVFDKTAAKGVPDGLFQCSMKAIRSAHIRANRMRAGLVVAGLFTDKHLYREVLTLFYIVTKELETKLQQYRETDAICAKILSLGYHFTPQYEADLQHLYGESWKEDIALLLERNDVARSYCTKIQAMTSGVELAGAAFCLWGALIIGGGAAAKPRVQALLGGHTTPHVFDSVTGPGRAQRRQNFVSTWDSLATPGTADFDDIVQNCQDCMQCNNDLITSVKRNPWWLSYLVSAGVGAVAVGAYFAQRALLRASEKR